MPFRVYSNMSTILVVAIVWKALPWLNRPKLELCKRMAETRSNSSEGIARFSCLYPARAVAAACIYDVLRRENISITCTMEEWCENVIRGVDAADVVEILDEMSSL
jgi:hypothetical protein